MAQETIQKNLHYPEAERGIICRTPNTFFRYHGWPTVTRDADGVLYAVDSAFRVNHICPFGKTALYRSYDGGKTWTVPSVVNDTYLDDRDAGILSLGGKKLLVTWFCHPAKNYMEIYGNHIRNSWIGNPSVLDAYPTIPEEEGRGGLFIRLSEDGGDTWGETIRVPVSSPHGPNILSDGTLVYLGKAMFTDELPDGAVAAYKSADGGKSWEKLAVLDIPEGTRPDNFHEPHVVELPSGRLLGMIRAEGQGVPFGFTMYETHSDDGGRSWSPMVCLNIPGSPPHLLLHSSGAVILSYGRRCEPFGERALVSYDDGESWPEEYVLHETVPCDLGYPASVELGDGSILTVYYQNYEGDANFTSLLYTKWKL
ncbi:MAG: exo-alpha-sialidase [Clostridia bacterium]|nr:exo-alpha-sialidase [Clostridia bacterium]